MIQFTHIIARMIAPDFKAFFWELSLEFAKRFVPRRILGNPRANLLLRGIIFFYQFVLRRTGCAAPRELQALHGRRLRRLVRAARRAPFWRGRLSLVRGTTSIEEIRPVTREELADGARERFLTEPLNVRTMIERRTSGTTGAPLVLFIDARTYFTETAAHYARMVEHYGISFRAISRRRFFFALNYYDPRALMFYPFLAENATIDFFAERESVPERVRGLAARMARGGSAGLFGHPPDLILLAQYFEELGAAPPLAFVITTGQRLETEAQRYLEEAFHCPVISYYGNQETGIIAFQCPRERETFHVCAERLILEVVDAALKPVPPDVPGTIVLTCLDFRTFPIIRYLTGDRGTLLSRSCGCGLELPRIQFEGRETEFITLPDGTRIPERRIHTLFLTDRFVRKVRQFQIVQKSRASLEIAVVPALSWTPRDKNELETLISGTLPPAMRVQIVIVPSIPRVGVKTRSFIPLTE